MNKPPKPWGHSLAVPVAAVLLLSAGCTVGPDFHGAQPGMPDGWYGSADSPGGAAGATQPSITTQQSIDTVRWWKSFNDPTLDSLVARAMLSNLDLRLAGQRLRQARGARGVVAADLFPNVNTSGSYRRSQAGGGADDSNSFTVPATGPNGGGATTTVNSSNDARDFWQAGFDASWEIDVFGGVRRGVEAADADIRAAVEDRRDVLVTLLSEVARNYLDLRGFQQQIAIARSNVEAQQRSAEVTRKRIIGGMAAGLDVANAEAQVASTSSFIPSLEAQAQQTIFALSVLLGQPPAALVEELLPAGPIPSTPPVVPVGLPSDLLRRRPDIRRAEAQLHAATARVGVAVADLFPRFSLTGSLGVEGSKFSSLGNWGNHFWSVGPSVSWPIFDAGRIRANIDVQNAAQEQALTQYERTVLVALQEVESALVAYSKEQVRRQSLTEAVAANRRAVDIATRLYNQGLTNFLNVIDAQRSLFASQDALVRSEQSVSTNLVALYKALGGGWEAEGERSQGPAK